MTADELRTDCQKAEVWLPDRIFEFAIPDCLEVWQPTTLEGTGGILSIAWIPPSDPTFSEDPKTTGRNQLERIRNTLDPNRIRRIEEKTLELGNLESAYQYTVLFAGGSERLVEILGRLPDRGLITVTAMVPPESVISDDVFVEFARSLRPYDVAVPNPSPVATRLNDLWVDVPGGFQVSPVLSGTLRPRSPFARVHFTVHVHPQTPTRDILPPEPPRVSDHRTGSSLGYSVLERFTQWSGHTVRAYVLLPSDQPDESYSLEEPVYAIYEGWLDCPERVIVSLTASFEPGKHGEDVLGCFDDWFDGFARAVSISDRARGG